MGILSKVFAGASLLALGAQADSDHVVVGTTSNWDQLLADNPEGLLAEFYAPWCGHCKKLDPEYKKAAETLKNDGVTVPLVKIDATVESKLASDFGVQGYPTMKWFVGGSPSEYDGPREATGIVAWIKSMSGPAVVEGEPQDDDKLAVTLYGDSLLEDFEAVAKANRKKASWYYQSGDAKITIKHKGEPAQELSAPFDKAAIEAFFTSNAFPIFGELNGDSFGTFMERGMGLVWTLLPMTAENVSEQVEANREMMTNVGTALSGEFSVTWTNTVEFGKVLESMFGVTEFPRLVIQKKPSDKKSYIYDGEMDQASIQAYIEKVKSGEVQPHLKSEAVPEPNDEPVKVIVGKTLEEEVFHAEKDVLLEVYAPWCGHCKKLDPEYIKVAKKVQKEGLEDILTIAKMDGTQNDSPVESISWSGFPTIVYVKAGSTTVQPFDGGRDAKSIWKWIRKNHSKADTIKDRMAARKESEGGAKEEL